MHVLSSGGCYSDGAPLPVTCQTFDTQEEAMTYGLELLARLTRGLVRIELTAEHTLTAVE